MLVHNVKVEIKAPPRRAREEPPKRNMEFYTVQKIGKTQSLTNEGFLLCSDVPIARTGTMIYSEEQTGLVAGRDGFVRIDRDDATVFRPETIASFEGKPVTNEHPTEEVGPENFRDHVVGVCQNVRRGAGVESDLLLADLLIYDKEAIGAIRDGKREVSCGYRADYEQTEPGRGRQLDIVGNHVALVDEGRCGSRCAIQDRRTSMAKKTFVDRIRDVLKTNDRTAIDAVLKDAEEEMGKGGTGEGLEVHVHNYGGKKEGDEEEKEGEGKEAKKEGDNSEVVALLKQLLEKLGGGASDESEEEEEGEEETDESEEEKKKNEDKKLKAAKATVQDFKSRVELLVPGFEVKLSTKDSKTLTSDMCNCKRKALSEATADEETKKLLQPLLTGVDLKKATADKVDTLFIAASELIRQKNNAAGARSASTKDTGKKITVADINAQNRAFWDGQRKSA